jgi:RES domain-containing protein
VKLYRVADTRHPLFDGTGAAMFPGRWNREAQKAIYASERLSCAMLEVLAHLPTGKIPATHGYIEIELPDDLPVETVDVDTLPGWNDIDMETARNFGGTWFAAARTPVLKVPSLIVPDRKEPNYVINQTHPHIARLTASAPRPVDWDKRLFKKAGTGAAVP